MHKFRELSTPFYYYDIPLLKKTLQRVSEEAGKYDYNVHYAVKANANDEILKIIRKYDFGADCVSGNEIAKVMDIGFDPEKTVFAGVGKSDWEINLALDHNIFCFNCESIQEIKVIDELAGEKGKIAPIALRINPNINPATHHYITTGIEENKFGIYQWELEDILQLLVILKNIKLIGLHFHIGSQIIDLNAFKGLCIRINKIQEWFIEHQIIVDHINVGGGLGINYENPDQHTIPDFAEYFGLFKNLLELRPKQKVHFELGRSMVAQCGSLITRVLYVKNGVKIKFAIVDAGMTELLRPALYQAYHRIENLTSNGKPNQYNVVGPICESSDSFGKYILLPETKRNDLLAIRSVGAYGEIMAFRYNLRDLVKSYHSDEL
ncbi:MAG: diaminopimelate decarboxylase [Bacteroidetes bacterium]|nr:diaminopimelate decarboxylase [Bacteroidota bacterium]